MTTVDQLGDSALLLFCSGKHVMRKGNTQRNGLSFLFLLVVVGFLVLFSQMVFFVVSLGHANMGLSMSESVGLGLGAKHSLSFFVREEEHESHNEEVWPKPYGWESYSFGLIRKHFACKAYAHDQTKPLPTLQDWRLFQSQYNKIVDDTRVFRDPVPPTMGYTLGDEGHPPYYAKHSADGRGRGLFASRDIKKGELTHDGTHSDILFPDGMSFRKFLFSLPRNKACDMIDWTWTQKLEDNGKYHIFSAINISVLHNGGASKDVNVNPKSSTSSKFHATRDIKKGEQLLTDYGMYDTVWNEVGLGHDSIVHSSLQLGQEHESHNEPVWPKPNGWESDSITQIQKHFACKAYAHDKKKPLPTLQDWKLFQSQYNKIVDDTRVFRDPVPPTMGYTLGDGGPLPFYANHSARRGRGLFASRDIKKGELTHDGTSTNIVFPDSMSWRRFIFSLPRNRACDMIDWTWTQKLEDNDKYHIFSAINISVLHNGGTGKDANVNPESPTSSKFHATRDIKKDEELLTDYFIYDAALKEVGLA